MTFSRSQSPAFREGTPDQLLTPRTKIRALLATVDSSDDEAGAEILKTSLAIAENGGSSRQSEDGVSYSSQKSRQMSDLDGESDVDVRPRGRLASRMQGVMSQNQSTNDILATSKAGTARERVRKMLQQEEKERVANEGVAAAQEAEEQNIQEEEDGDDQLPVAPRRLKRRIAMNDTSDDSQSQGRAASPGLFVSSPARPSPTKSTSGDIDGSEDDLPAIKSDRFKALVERKRRERLEREAAEEARRAERRAQQEKLTSELDGLDSNDDNVSDIMDDEGGRALTQQARPTRKASKKAVEEMTRETQRMARNMQLAHEAKTRKKITKASLFERFNYKPVEGLEPLAEPNIASSSRPTTPQTDVDMNGADTPPSSPPIAGKQDMATYVVKGNDALKAVGEEKLPSVDEVMSPATEHQENGKGRANEIEEIANTTKNPKRRFRVKLPELATNHITIDDDELEITTTTKDRLGAVFDNLPSKKARESQSLQALRALAQLKSPAKNKKRMAEHCGMTVGELQRSLYQKARQQAKQERDSRLEILKAQGTIVQTAEERERQMQEVEDIVAKAREEAQKIMQQEHEEAKQDGKKAEDPLAWDDSEDEEYRNSASETEKADSAIELSGSEDDGGEDDGEEGDDEDEEVDDEDGGMLVDGEAEEEESDKYEDNENSVLEKDVDEGVRAFAVARQRGSRKKTAVLSDDEGDVRVEATPKPKATIQMSPAAGVQSDSPTAPTSVLRSAKKTFIPGLPVQGPAGLGLTQIFAGTMDDSQTNNSPGMPTQSMMPDFDNFPDSNFSATADASEDMVVDSQPYETLKGTQAIRLDLSQSQMHGLGTLVREDSLAQMSQGMDLTQDAGFQKHTPLRERFVEPPVSTVETVKVDSTADAPGNSPLVRRGRLRRKAEMQLTAQDKSVPSSEKTEEAGSTFHAMMGAAQKEKRDRAVDDFNRKKSKAKEMVEEQAEESEDEYAGLGGVDGEDSDNESAASVQDLIDDAAGNDVDESKLAAFYADRARANDEKEVEKLFKDITTGMLRRKRGADYDLSDSDDGGEARRRMKRRQFSKMQKALFADERVKKMAENPGNQAFLRTIEDRNSDDEMDILDVVDIPTIESQSQSQSQDDDGGRPQHTVPDSQPRQPLLSAAENRAPAYLRRTRGGKKPSNIGEVRETLSDLLDDAQGSVVPATEIGSDSEEDERHASERSDKENQAPDNRRTKTAVVDRISLKRSASSNLSAGNGSSRLAFSASIAATSFKVPALLRRATTNSSLISGSSSSDTVTGPGSAGGFGEEAKIKKTAGKMSSVHGFARENERRAKIHEGERRRQEKRARGAERRVGLVGGLLGKGSFA